MSPYIRQETAISMAINTGFSLAFFLLVFGVKPSVSVPGVGGYAFDFLPQSFAIALMSTLVPGAIAARRVRTGRLPRLAYTSCLPRRLWLRVVVVAVLAMVVGGGSVCAMLLALGPLSIGWWPAMIAKLAYGAALAGVVTPPTLRAAMR